MSIEWIIIVGAVIILWLVIKAALKMVMISFSTALQIFIILVVLRVFFTIMPQDVLQQIREIPQLVWNFF
jgi:hypothetical protein